MKVQLEKEEVAENESHHNQETVLLRETPGSDGTTVKTHGLFNWCSLEIRWILEDWVIRNQESEAEAEAEAGDEGDQGKVQDSKHHGFSRPFLATSQMIKVFFMVSFGDWKRL